MTLRQEIRTALDEVTPPAPHLRYAALDAAAAARPVRRGRVVKLALPAAAAPLVAALLVVIALIAFRALPGQLIPGLAPGPPAVDDGSYLSLGHFGVAGSAWIVRRHPTDAQGRPGGALAVVFQSADGGRIWRERLRFNGEYDGMSFSPDGNRAVVWGEDTSAPWPCPGSNSCTTPQARPGFVYRTDDGGDHWDRRLTPTGQQMYAMDFLDVDHGWLLAYPERGGPGRLTVYRTQDGGGLWRPVGEVSFGRGDYGTVFGTANRTVRFANPDDGWLVPNGYAGFDQPLLWTTHDGGGTWAGQRLPPPDGATATQASAGQPAIFVDGSGVLPVMVRSAGRKANDPEPSSKVWLYMTTDRGRTWSGPRALFPPGSHHAEEELVGTIGVWQFLDARHWWVPNRTVSGGGPWAPPPKLLVTADGGRTWRTYDPNPLIIDLAFVSASEGWAEDASGVAHVNGLIHSSDSGAHWSRVRLPRILQ